LDPGGVLVIDFRTFLVSIAAVFMALAVGVVLGAGPLKGGLDSQLRGEVEQLGKEKDQLRTELERLEQTDKYRDAFATEISPGLIGNRLTGRQIVLVALPDADGSTVSELRTAVTDAGAEVTGTVQVTDKWADPKQRQFLEDLASQLVTGDITLPDNGTAYDRAGAVLARAVVTDDEDAAGQQDDATPTIMGALGEGDLVKSDDDMARADLAVVIAPEGQPVPEARADRVDEANQAWVSLCRALDEASNGCVLAGDPTSAEEHGVLAALRDDGNASQDLSSVDVANLPSGQVAVVWALVEQTDGGAGQYGAVGTTDGALPQFATGS
jgi:hypothetical protein